MNSAMREKRDHVILYVEPKYLNSDKDPERMSKPIAYLACTLKSNFVEVFNIIVCNNKYNEKGIICTANMYLFKVNNRNTRKRSEICSKLTIKTPGRRH